MESQDEAALLERVFLRIGSAETDEQLEGSLGKFLVPVLIKLSSPVESIRKKVMELLVHINKRLKSRPMIQLPIQALLNIYSDSNTSAFVTNFTILYLKMGFPRLPPEEQAQLIPQLLTCLPPRPEAQQTSLLQLVISALQYVTYPSNIEKKKDLFRLTEQSEASQLLLDYMMDVLLLPYNYATREEKRQSDPAATANSVESATPVSGNPIASPAGPPHGLSEKAFNRMKGDNPPTPDGLEKMKLAILTMLGSDIFPDDNVICHLVVATADSRHYVVNAADKELRRLAGSDDWNKSAIIAKLYSLFLGTIVVKGQPGSNVKQDMKRAPAGIPLRLKIFPYLLRSSEAANQFPACMQIVFDAVHGVNTNARIKQMALQFIHHLTFSCSDQMFKPIGPIFLNMLVKMLKESQTDSKLKNLVYVAIGKLGRRQAALVSANIALLQTLFNALSTEEQEQQLAVQETLSMLCDAFCNPDSTRAKLLEALVMQNMETTQWQCRSMAVQYAANVFPPDHIPSRYALLLACSDSKEEIATEAKNALHKGRKSEESADPSTQPIIQLPDFSSMVNYIDEKSADRVQSPMKYMVGNHTLAFNPATYTEILKYLRMCLTQEAGAEPSVDMPDKSYKQAPAIAAHITQRYGVQSLVDSASPIAVYLKIIRQVLTALGGVEAMYCLLELVAVARHQLAPHFITDLPWIKNQLSSGREEIRQFAAELYAIVVTTSHSVQQISQDVVGMISSLQNQALEGQCGTLLALAQIAALLLRREKQDADSDTRSALVAITTSLASHLKDKRMMLSQVAMAGLGVVGQSGRIPLPSEGDAPSVLSVINSIVATLQSDKEHAKMRERAAISLGQLCVGDAWFPHRTLAINSIIKTAGPKQFELHVTLGESLVAVAEGPHSTNARDRWTVTPEQHQSRHLEEPPAVSSLADQILKECVASPNPYIRQAGCVWLVAVVQRCGGYETIKTKFMQLQQAFMSLLSESDELTQDIASKGLGMVYENCDASQKEQLVSTLVGTLTSSRSTQHRRVDGDTQVFQEGALGKTPDGQNMSTYKELCSIATDLNQPDLIYKFMHLANHQALWNSKKGAAFGFSTIAAQAGEQLAPYLPKIVPKLYRYQFDPNPRIQQAMLSIWGALVKDSKKTVDEYLVQIADDLIKNATNPQWRIRESSCLAVNDLLRGRVLDNIVPRLPELWETLLRVRDDIKESVRNAADHALKTLSKVSIRLCDASQGKVGADATSQVLPCLLKSGLGNQLPEARALALATIVKIAKTAGALLKPHIPQLVTMLLEALSTLEPQYLNYLSLHVAGSQNTEEKLDSARVAASKSSPMMETVNMCVQHVDSAVLEELVPRLTDLLRSGVGLGTKVGCCSLIISLVQQYQKDLAPFAGKLLASLMNGLNDRNATVRKSCASALGYVVKIAKDSSIEKLTKRLHDWYMDKEEGTVRQSCGVAIQAMSRRCPDVLKRHGAMLLPLAYLAMHEQSSDGKENTGNSVWEEIWIDSTPGTEAGLRLYVGEIVNLSKAALASQSWPMKAQGASTLSAMASKLGSGDSLAGPHITSILQALLTGLQGRTWTGKEALLTALSSVCSSCKDALKAPVEGQPTVDDLITAVLKECKKSDVAYSTAGIKCLGVIVETYQLNKFSDVTQLVYPPLTESLTKDSKEQASDRDINLNTWISYQQSCFKCLGRAWPSDAATQAEHQSQLCSLLSRSLGRNVWKVDLVILETLHSFIKSLQLLQSQEMVDASRLEVEEILRQVVPPVCLALGNLKYGAIRSEALDILQCLIHTLAGVGRLHVIEAAHLETIKDGLRHMISETQGELHDKASDLLKSIS